AKYRKTHLVTAAPLDERICLSPGNEFVTSKIGNFNVGLSICYDLRFPEMARALVVKHGANVIVNSSAWPVVRAEHLRILALARLKTKAISSSPIASAPTTASRFVVLQ